MGIQCSTAPGNDVAVQCGPANMSFTTISPNYARDDVPEAPKKKQNEMDEEWLLEDHYSLGARGAYHAPPSGTSEMSISRDLGP